MIYPVSIYREGKRKKTISSRTLHRHHWQDFEKNEVRRRKEFACGTAIAAHKRQLAEMTEFNSVVDNLQQDHG